MKKSTRQKTYWISQELISWNEARLQVPGGTSRLLPSGRDVSPSHTVSVWARTSRCRQPELSQSKMSCSMTKPTTDMCAHQRLWSAWASALSDQCLCCALFRKLRDQHCSMWTVKTDQTGRKHRLTWVFTGCIVILLVLSCCGSNIN